MFHPALFGLSGLFGGGPWTRNTAPYLGLFMVGAFALLAVRFWSHNYLQPADWKWLRQIRDVVNKPRGALARGRPLQRRPEAALLGHRGMPAGLLLTGIVIWRAWFSLYFRSR